MSKLTSDTKNRIESALAQALAKKDLIGALGVTGASFTVGAEAANVINVAVQLSDENGDCTEVKGVVAGLFSAAAATAFNATNYTTIAIGTDGALLEVVADKLLFLTSEADGDIDIDITLSSGGATSYLGVLLADGSWAFSGAITHAA